MKLLAGEDDSSAPHQGNAWPDEVSTFSCIPKYWLWQLITSLQPQFTSALMKLIDSHDRNAVRKLGEYAFQLDGRFKCPPQAAADPKVMARVLTDRHVEAGMHIVKNFSESNAISMQSQYF